MALTPCVVRARVVGVKALNHKLGLVLRHLISHLPVTRNSSVMGLPLPSRSRFLKLLVSWCCR